MNAHTIVSKKGNCEMKNKAYKAKRFFSCQKTARLIFNILHSHHTFHDMNTHKL